MSVVSFALAVIFIITASWLANGKAEDVTAEVIWNLMSPDQGSEFGNLSQQTLQGMAGRTNFPPTIPFPVLFVILLNLGNLWNYNQITSWLPQFIKNGKYDVQYIYRTVRFRISSSSYVCNARSCKEGRFIKYNTITRAILLLQFTKGLRAGFDYAWRAVGCQHLR